MHPACSNKKQNHLQNSLLRRTQFWVRKTFSKPASLKRASLVALPVAISHKVSLKPKRCASATLIQKTSKNEPKHGPKNGTAWRSHFWDPHAQLSKRTKEKHFHGPIFGTVRRVPKMRPQNRKIHNKGRPLQQTKDYNCIYLSKQHIDLGTVALSGRHKPQSFIETKTLRLLQPLIQKNFKKMNLNTVPKMGPPGGPIFGDRMHSLVKEQKKSTFTVPFFGTVRRYQKWDRKIAKSTTKADPLV